MWEHHFVWHHLVGAETPDRMVATADPQGDGRATAARRAEPLRREEAASGTQKGQIRTSDSRGRNRSR